MLHGSKRGRELATLALLRVVTGSVPLAVCSLAAAAGIEDTVGGTVGLGRAASYARVNDFMATAQNPANLALVPRAELAGELRLPLLHGCFDREPDPSVEYKQPGAYPGFEGTESFGEVCNAAPPLPTGNIGWAQSFAKRWGYGVGLFTPAAAGRAKYGDDTIVTWYPEPAEQYTPTNTGVESPNRQLLLERTGLLAFLMAGAGWAPTPKLRFGASAGVGFFQLSNKTVVSVVGGTFRDQEVLAEIEVRDWAVPRVVGSVVVTPLDALELFAVAVYQGDISAHGRAELTSNGIRGAPLKSCTDALPGTHCELDDARVRVPFPTMETTFGVRYALARKRRERVLDPLRDEYFDLELDVSWAQTSDVDAYRITLHQSAPDSPNPPSIQFANISDPAVLPIRPGIEIPKRWTDTWGVRVGGDINVVPGWLAIRGGFSWSSRAVPVSYMNIDYWPVRKFGLHLGGTLALGRVQLSAAYAHLFYQDVTVAVGTGSVKDISFQNEAQATGVNEGSFSASQDIISGQMNVAF